MTDSTPARGWDFEVVVTVSPGLDFTASRGFALGLMEGNARLRGLKVDPDSLKHFTATGFPTESRRWKGRQRC